MSPFLRRLLLLPALLFLAGEARGFALTWNGHPLPARELSGETDADWPWAQGNSYSGPSPRKWFAVPPGPWGDSLHLVEFSGDLAAYAAFQEVVRHPDDLGSGWVLVDRIVYFRAGQWIGRVSRNWMGPTWLLGFSTGPQHTGVPGEFSSLLQQGRLPGSERLLHREFLGFPVASPVLSVQLDCHGDTATVFASPRISAGFERGLQQLPGWRRDSSTQETVYSAESPQRTPVLLKFTNTGMVGVEGCFDKNLTLRWLEMQARALKSLKKAITL